ncbi:hypothetical protein DB347_19470 [Opitutaceae bacterium EW11]|nr:hypothetical protein DB347_19470 [Opitutaceae bacterium EW11]
MNAQSPSAYVASLVLHGLFVAAILLSAWAMNSNRASTKIFELVAGEGDNYGATEAPALGTPEGTKDQSEASAPAQPPAVPVQIEAVAAPPATVPKATPTTPNFTRTITRISNRVRDREMKKFEKEQKAKAEAEERAAAKEAAAAKSAANRMTKEEFDRRYGKQLAANSARTGTSGTIKTSRIDAKGISGGVVGGSTANTKGGAGGPAMTREEGDMLDAYFSLLIQRLKNAHERPTGVSDVLTAQAEFSILADGTIFDVRISRSSGNAEFDQSVLSAFRNVGSIGPRPDGEGTLTRRVTFKMRDD